MASNINNGKKVPKTLHECTVENDLVKRLRYFAAQLEKWGGILCGILIIVGVLSTVTDGINAAEISEDLVFPTCLATAAIWGICAFAEFFLYQIFAMLINALANITHNTDVTANVALLTANTNPDIPNGAPSKTTSNPQPSPIFPSVNKSNARWVCPWCGASNKGADTRCEMCGNEKG